MKNENISKLGNAILNLRATLGYFDTDNNMTIADLIDEIIAQYKSDNEVLKIREEECKKLRVQVGACKQWVNTLYGHTATDPEVMNHEKTEEREVLHVTKSTASATAVVFSTPVGYIPINTDLDHLNDLKYIRDIYNNLRDSLKDALNEIDSMREDLAEEHKERVALECNSDTYEAIIDGVHAHFSDSMNMDSEEFQNIVDYCREWI